MRLDELPSEVQPNPHSCTVTPARVEALEDARQLVSGDPASLVHHAHRRPSFRVESDFDGDHRRLFYRALPVTFAQLGLEER